MEKEDLILSKLNSIESELSYIREHIIDITLTEDDISSLKEAEKDLKSGKTRRL
ncbi:MAG: hypothetical protein AABY03_02610 [Nanoarchaeota archaeon]